MISHLSGRIFYKEEKYLVIEVGGIGYKVFVMNESLEKSVLGENITLWTHQAIREDSHDLYGFETKDELDFFELLIGISGIGPKSALNILNVASLSALKKAISSGDTSHLVKVSGIGKKSADKIVLELKGKFGDGADEPSLREEVDALEALKSLGFTHKDARDALKEVGNGNTEERVKAALKFLGK